MKKTLLAILLSLNVAYANSVGGGCAGSAQIQIDLNDTSCSGSSECQFHVHFKEFYQPFSPYGNRTNEWQTSCINGSCTQMPATIIVSSSGYAQEWTSNNNVRARLHAGTNNISFQFYNPEYGCNYTATGTITMA